MYWCKLILVLTVLVSHVIVITAAIKCYECETDKDGWCGSDFQPDMASTCNDGGICRKVVNKHRGIIDRRSDGQTLSKCYKRLGQLTIFSYFFG